MPGMDGLQVLDEIRKAGIDVGVIIVSSVTVSGGSCTIKALERGAFDFITKPSEGNVAQNRSAVYDALSPRVRAFARKREISSILNGATPKKTKTSVPDTKKTSGQGELLAENHSNRPHMVHKPELILIGVSTGGPAALATLLPSIPQNIGVPILIVQHMPPMFTKALAASLSSKCSIKVCEAATGDVLQPGVAYIAPGGKQLKLGAVANSELKTVFVNDDPPENNCRPSVDYLFRSAANNFPGKNLAVILTGMGSDGTLGLRLLKRHGCFIIAQDEPSCVVYGMPRSAVESGVVDVVLPLDEIAAKIANITRKGI